jgi:predicted ATPase
MPPRRPTGFLRSARLAPGDDRRGYPWDIPAVRRMGELRFDRPITLIAGDNGSGKSTILEAVAVAAGMNAEGGGRNFAFATRSTESPLHEAMRLTWDRRPRTDFFLRAESFYNVATQVEALDEDGGLMGGYGGRSPHEQSHGESFLALAVNRFGPGGLYLLDEPESALSPMGQLALIVRMHDLVAQDCQFVVATHSPFLLAYPGARILLADGAGIRRARYDDLEGIALYRSFLADPDAAIAGLLDDADDEAASDTGA